MKIIRFFKENFQLFNFFFASLIVGLLYGWWYLPNSSEQKLSNNDKTNLVQEILSDELPPVEIIESPAIVASPQINATENYNPPEVPENNSLPQVSSSPLLPELPANNLNFPQEPLPNEIARQAPVPNQVQTYLGHYPFKESPRKNLVKAGDYYDRIELLDRETANAFQQMQADANKQGIKLIIISGFRSVATQEALFKRQIERKGGIEAAARYSAPPGHSEHHTGYALDIGDGNNPNTDLKVAFSTTPAFQWLANTAHKYGFELSFLPDNLQGVSYEPWHWRYVGTQRAHQIFFHARNMP
jgi:D-alanyl-D-alanine carboxypeptidase